MSERKVINKYYPINYEPSKLKRVRKPKGASQQVKVRMALPMSVQCVNCGNFMARGSKFNARKEVVAGESYLGMHVLRFYFRCAKCFQELTMKTDPKNCDYVVEHGLKAGFVLHKASAEEEAQEAEEREKLEGFDKMKALEKKSLESLAEMELNDAIDTVLYVQSKRAQLSSEELHQRALQALDPTIEVMDEDADLTEEDWAELAEMQKKMASRGKNITETLKVGIPTVFKSGIVGEGASGDISDEEDDPIALRSKLALEKLREQQFNKGPSMKELLDGNITSGEDEIAEESKSTSTPTTPSISSPTTPKQQSMSLFKPAFKVPIAKPILSSAPKSESPSTSASSIIVVSTSSPTSKPLPASSTTGNSLLGIKKYSRNDDDEA